MQSNLPEVLSTYKTTYVKENLSRFCLHRIAITRIISFLFLAFFFTSTTLAQSSPEWTASAEIGGFVSSIDRIPFWLRANQWGVVPLTPSIGTARAGIHFHSPRAFADTLSRKNRIHWEFGMEGVTNAGVKNKLLLPEAFATIHWKGLELMGGRKRQIMGIVDTTLSSGSYSWSGNTLPIPMIRLGFSDYVPLGFLKNFLSLKGYYAHGWFDESYIEGAYFHQKTLHGRFGKPEGKIHFQLGLIHNVVWGGSADYLRDNPVAVNGKLTTNFGEYIWGVLLGQIPKEKTTNRISYFDGTNRVGNHVGHVDMALDWRIRKMSFLLYRQHPFEDASGLQFQNLPDGLYGIVLQRNIRQSSFFALKGLVLEFLYTKNQSGNTFDLIGRRFKGVDNYFNHAQYREGWSYRQQGMGTPFIPASPEVGKDIVITPEYFPTNRAQVYHAGLELLVLKKIRIVGKFSYSLNFGTVNVPFQFPIKQYSSLLSFDTPLLRWGNTRLKAQIAYDQGELYPKSMGGYLGLWSTLRHP